jgi:enoyl reductase-like protein
MNQTFPIVRPPKVPALSPMSEEVRRLKHECHVAFDKIWKTAGQDLVAERKLADDRISKLIRRQRRNLFQRVRIIARFYMAHRLNVSPDEAHIARMTDVKLLKRYLSLATGITIKRVTDWWDSEGQDRFGDEFKAALDFTREVQSWNHMEDRKAHKS